MGKMHVSRLESCERLKELDSFLRSRGARGATSIEITDLLRRPAASTDISELRANLRARGETVKCDPDGKTDTGRKRYRYWIVPLGQSQSGVETTGAGPQTPEGASPMGSLNQPAPVVAPPDRLEDLEQGDLFGRQHARAR